MVEPSDDPNRLDSFTFYGQWSLTKLKFDGGTKILTLDMMCDENSYLTSDESGGKYQFIFKKNSTITLFVTNKSKEVNLKYRKDTLVSKQPLLP